LGSLLVRGALDFRTSFWNFSRYRILPPPNNNSWTHPQSMSFSHKLQLISMLPNYSYIEAMKRFWSSKSLLKWLVWERERKRNLTKLFPMEEAAPILAASYRNIVYVPQGFYRDILRFLPLTKQCQQGWIIVWFDRRVDAIRYCFHKRVYWYWVFSFWL
jgi:hypothetical protein